jgi:hypothetical protein
MKNYTQGEWQVNPNNKTELICFQGNRTTKTIADFFTLGSENGLNESIENAMLCASAPKLHTLVSQMLEHLENKAEKSKTDFVEDEFIRQAKILIK